MPVIERRQDMKKHSKKKHSKKNARLLMIAGTLVAIASAIIACSDDGTGGGGDGKIAHIQQRADGGCTTSCCSTNCSEITPPDKIIDWTCSYNVPETTDVRCNAMPFSGTEIDDCATIVG